MNKDRQKHHCTDWVRKERESKVVIDAPPSDYTSDLKIGTPVATLPDAWCSRVSAGTGWSGVSRLSLGEVESLFAVSMSARQHVQLSELSRSVSEIHKHVAGTLSNQQTTTTTLQSRELYVLTKINIGTFSTATLGRA